MIALNSKGLGGGLLNELIVSHAVGLLEKAKGSCCNSTSSECEG
jgi:hypothetical protein